MKSFGWLGGSDAGGREGGKETCLEDFANELGFGIMICGRWGSRVEWEEKELNCDR